MKNKGASRKETFSTSNVPNKYKGVYLSALDFPVGALGGSVIRMNGKAERAWWHIFNNNEERPGSGAVPNSFFAVRAQNNGIPSVRTLQTTSIGPFKGMKSLSFEGEYPFGSYCFSDNSIPVDVKLETYNPLIPMDLKNSAIPCAIYKITVKNNSVGTTKISILATQQNAVGFDGYGTIGGKNKRSYIGYGKNENNICSNSNKTALKMTGNNGSMQLSCYDDGISSTASWDDLELLFKEFSENGILTGPCKACSEKGGVTVNGALSKDFDLTFGQTKTVVFVLSWHFPDGISGKGTESKWCFKGQQYQNWWNNANEVDEYVETNFEMLETKTRLFHDTLYSSSIPRYALDRISSNICVLKSPTVFWAKNGYFGMWESTSSNEVWSGNCKHVYQYAQAIAWIYPQLARTIMEQNLKSQTEQGLFSARDEDLVAALDGHFGTILGLYREHLLTDNNKWLSSIWPKTKKSMDYAISTFDNNLDGLLTGKYDNTLDCATSGTNPFIGSMYLAALKACEKMAEISGDAESEKMYSKVFKAGVINQNAQLWDAKLSYYVEKSENISDSYHFGNGCYINMMLGQWWANMLDLGQIYPEDRTRNALKKIYANNRFTDHGGELYSKFRDFLGTGDTGWIMNKFPDHIPDKPVLYYDEVMSGFEYPLAATLIQYGMTNEGLDVVCNISKRYNGRHRGEDEVTVAENATVYGTGSPFGEDECGDFYGRALSSWSILAAALGYSYDGPKKTIRFRPNFMADNCSSFFSTSNGYGLFIQMQSGRRQVSKIEMKYGDLELKIIVLMKADSYIARNIYLLFDEVPYTNFKDSQSGNILTINLAKELRINSGNTITVEFDC